MERIRYFFVKHKYFFRLFLFILSYELIVVGRCSPLRVGALEYSYYALDHTMGIASRMLPGVVYNLIFPVLNYKILTIGLIILLISFFFVLCIFLEKVLMSVELSQRKLYGIFCFFLLTGPFTFTIFAEHLGILEFYWVMAAFVFLLLMIAPAPFSLLAFIPGIFCVLVDYAAVLCYVLFFCCILLYRISVAEKKDRIILFVSLLLLAGSSFAVFLYLLTLGKNDMRYSLEEFEDILRSRGVTFFDACKFILYGVLPEEGFPAGFYLYQRVDSVPSATLSALLGSIKSQLELGVRFFEGKTVLTLLYHLAICSPLLWVFYRFFVERIKTDRENKLKQFSFVCMLVLFLFTVVTSKLFSVNHTKWFSFAFLPLFISFLFVLYHEKEEGFISLKKIMLPFSDGQIAAYGFVYMLCVLNAYE